MSEMESKPKKPNILVRVLALLVTAALLIGAVFLVANRDKFNLDALKRWFEYRDLKTSDTGEAAPFSHAGGDQATFAYLEDGILLSSTSGVRYYSFSGETYAQEVLTLEHPTLSTAGATGVAYDVGGQNLFVFRNAQEAFRLTLDDENSLLSARVNEAGWLAVTAQQSGYKGSVTVYNSTFDKTVIQINLSSTFIMDAVLSPDCKTVAILTLGQSGGSYESQVRFYPVDQKEPSAVVSLGNLAPLDLDYENGALWVLGEDEVVIVSPNGKETATYSLGGNYLKGCDLGGDGFAVLLLGRYRAGSANQIVTVNSNGEEIATQSLTSSVLSFDAAGRYFSLLTGDTLTIYTSDMTTYSILEHTQNARYTALSSSGAAVLANAQQAWLYLPN